ALGYSPFATRSRPPPHAHFFQNYPSAASKSIGLRTKGKTKKEQNTLINLMPSYRPPPPSPTCPFCAIASAHAPFPPSVLLPPLAGEEEEKVATGNSSEPLPQTHLILSTRHVLAFLDIMPLTRGHVLVISRAHYERLGQVGIGLGREVGPFILFIDLF